MIEKLKSVDESPATLDIELVQENRKKINELIDIVNILIKVHPEIEKEISSITGNKKE